MSAAVYENFVAEFARGSVDWAGEEFKVMLITGRYQPDQWKDDTRGKLMGAEAEPSGTYRRGGQTLEGRDVAGGFPGDIRLTGGTVRWENFSGEFRYAVVVRSSDGLLASYSDLGTNTVKNATVTVEYDQEGVCAFLVSPAS